MSVLIVVQARLGSTRLPSKVLLPLGSKPVLQHVVERCQRTGYPVVVATTPNDGFAIAPALHKLDQWIRVVAYDGAESDLLARYARAAEQFHDKSLIVRITADCPLVDPRLIEAAVQAVQSGFPYAGNTVERHWPRGLDVEAFTTDLLLRAHREAVSPYDREHVTPWMQRHSIQYALPASVLPLQAPNRWRWCLDLPSDFEWLQGAYNANGDPSVEQVAAYASLNPPPTD